MDRSTTPDTLQLSDQPIIIVGAGPAGSVLALYLAQHQIPVLLLEKEATLSIDLRASTFHPPTLEMLNSLGILDEMLEKGLRVDNYQYRDKRTGDVANFDMSLIAQDTPFPFRLQLEQYEMTRIVAAKLKQYPHAAIHFNHEVTDVSQNQESVTVTCHTPDGEKQYQTPFLVGADGAGSRVRKAVNIEYSGFTYDEKFLVVSTSFPFETQFKDLAYVNYISDADEWCVILRTEKKWRVLWPADLNQHSEAEYLSDRFIQEKLHRLYDKEGDYDIGHRTLYNVHQRVAETYYKQRVVLVGDACHINNPLGGMGMNGGLHDSFNLGEKLVQVLKEGANYDEAFAHYTRQRRNLAAKFIQEHTINNKKLIEASDRELQEARQKNFMDTARDKQKAREFILERAMINCVQDSLQIA